MPLRTYRTLPTGPAFIETLSAELMEMIADLLDLSDLQNFRLSSQWAERSTYLGFGRRGFEDMDLRLSDESARLFAQSFPDNKQRASWVRRLVLTMQYAEGPGPDVAGPHESYIVRLQRQQSLNFDTLATGRLLMLLPNLKDLQLCGLSIKSMQHQLDLGVIIGDGSSANPGSQIRLHSLEIRDSLLSPMFLKEIIRAFGLDLKKLKMTSVASIDGGWREFFSQVAELDLVHLEWYKLEYPSLEDERIRWRRVMVQDEHARVDKFFPGYQHMWAGSDTMVMNGNKAFQYGMKWAQDRISA
ncbi:hypothetical protein LTR10_010415 [Elasticomyces elasticus]|nr:hypothetical protein LTR10_010415 [Elasticomyces elasticus]KAK4972317.1 hypothetical protein LTR42_006824 [Elasticomyces elasticus]